MQGTSVDPHLIKGAWQGREPGCLLGKPVELVSFRHGRADVQAYLDEADASPLRHYVPLIAGSNNESIGAQIRADLCGWVCPGRPHLAAELARRDASFSHRGERVNAAAFIASGWDTDCNGATVGGLFGLTGEPVPEKWTRPWNGRIAADLAGFDELTVDALVDRTVTVAQSIGPGEQQDVA